MNNNQVLDQPTTKKRRRVFVWIFLAVQCIYLAWIITGAASEGHSKCANLSAHTCAAATDTGTAIGVGIVIALWVATDIVLGSSYLVWRLARRGR